MSGVRIATPRRTILFDIVLLFASTVLAIVAGWVIITSTAPSWMLAAALAGLALIAVGSVIARWIGRPDHLKAMQSHRMLEIANGSLGHLRQGLTEESAAAVCRLALEQSEAAAVAITDTERVLGFAGIGEDHHVAGGPIMTRGTREVIESNEYRILESRAEIGCPERRCPLSAAIIAPLEMRGAPVGTLKFYYTYRSLLSETQVAMAEALARLLSTQLELSELERQTELACRMELKALQAQIHPHFLFNTINTIAMFIRTDPEKARELLRDFARFYRRTLEATEDLVPIEQELEYVRTYLSFEKARFGERLKVVERVDSRACELLIPSFAIQPVVENSVQHGMKESEPLRVEIAVRRVDSRVEIEVTDDGAGIAPDDLGRVLEPGFGKGLGIALKNVDDRLKGHYGPGSGLAVESRKGGGTRVLITVVPDGPDRGGTDDAQSARRR